MSWTTSLDSPVGPLQLIAAGDGALTHLLFVDERLPARAGSDLRADRAPFGDVIAQLEEYFAGSRTEFELPLAPAGTAFQRDAWTALRAIPYGATRSYAEQAAALGRPRAIRAVGAANGRNPIAIVVPCHRVVGSRGALTGYGGGVERKEWLLGHERRHAAGSG
jgi:methylated-DNA-[protein]-cysteine S-methyltransferase